MLTHKDWNQFNQTKLYFIIRQNDEVLGLLYNVLVIIG